MSISVDLTHEVRIALSGKMLGQFCRHNTLMCYRTTMALVVLLGCASFRSLARAGDLYQEPVCGPTFILRHAMRGKTLFNSPPSDPISQVRIDGKDVFEGIHSELFFGPKLRYGAIKFGESYAVKLQPGPHTIKIYVENDWSKEYEIQMPEGRDCEATMVEESFAAIGSRTMQTKVLDSCASCCSSPQNNQDGARSGSMPENYEEPELKARQIIVNQAQSLKSEYASGLWTKEEYAQRMRDLRRQLKTLDPQTANDPAAGKDGSLDPRLAELEILCGKQFPTDLESSVLRQSVDMEVTIRRLKSLQLLYRNGKLTTKQCEVKKERILTWSNTQSE